MLENIKSFYFIKLSLSLIDEGTKLKIIQHNKKFQNMLDINIINYQIFTEKSTIYLQNGECEVYNIKNNIIIFKGKYVNGKKNGFGKEYYFNGKLKFEGEFLNGEKIRGKEYDKIDGELIFEGEYLNDERWKEKEKNLICMMQKEI